MPCRWGPSGNLKLRASRLRNFYGFSGDVAKIWILIKLFDINEMRRRRLLFFYFFQTTSHYFVNNCAAAVLGGYKMTFFCESRIVTKTISLLNLCDWDPLFWGVSYLRLVAGCMRAETVLLIKFRRRVRVATNFFINTCSIQTNVDKIVIIITLLALTSTTLLVEARKSACWFLFYLFLRMQCLHKKLRIMTLSKSVVFLASFLPSCLLRHTREQSRINFTIGFK